jgi:IgA Peptidase M64
LVNSSQWGGAGGSIAKFSQGGNWVAGAIHEMGHTLFGLADEYEYWIGCGMETDHDDYRNWIIHWEPGEPNVTGETNRNAIKWRDLILPATAVPTTSNPNCTTCDPQSSPVSSGTVGLFEGAGYYHCGLFRPEFNCMMRVTGVPFCAVCTRRIRQKLAPYWLYVVSQPLSISVQPSQLPPGKPTSVLVQVQDGYTKVPVSALIVINGQQVGQSNAPFTFTLTGGPVTGAVTAADYLVGTFVLGPAPLPLLRLQVTPSAIPFGLPTTFTVHAEDSQTAATVAGTVRLEGTTVGSTDTPFNRTFAPKIVSEFDPETKAWLSGQVDPEGSVSAPGYSDTPIPFTFYEAHLRVSAQPGQIPVGTPTQVKVTAVDDFTQAPVAGSVRIDGQLVGTTNTPFILTLAGSQAIGTVQVPGYPTASFTIKSPPPPRLRVWTQPFPVPTGVQTQLTVYAVNDQTNSAVDGAVLVDGLQVGTTNAAFPYTLIEEPAEFDPELKTWFPALLPTGTVSATGFPETVFRWK